jgi:hypothetical protein
MSALQATGPENKSMKQTPSDTVNPASTNDGQRAVLTVTPREIDLGSIRPGETAQGEFSLKNVVPGGIEWSAYCPEDWQSAAGKISKVTTSNGPTYLKIELAIAENMESNLGDKSRASIYRTSMKMDVEGKELLCQKDLKAGAYRKAIRLTSTGGRRTIFVDFRIHALQAMPSISLNPQRLDLGEQLPGKIISRRIELTNKGRDMLRWSVAPLEARPGELSRELQKEKYFSFHNEEVAEQGKYVVPAHLSDSMELIGLWEKKELVVAEGLPDGPHMASIVVREGSLELEGVKVFGKNIMKGPKGWIMVFPNSGTTLNETDYINVKVDTSYLAPGYYGDQIVFKSNAGLEIAEIFVDITSDMGQKVIDVYLYTKDLDYLFTADPLAESKRLIQNGYIKEGIAFRLFAAQTPGTTSFHRWYNPQIKDHFYHYDRTGGGKKLNGYVYEGAIGNIATSRMTNTRELYRWFNPATGRHYFSTNPKGASGARKGYRFEGIAGYVR